MQVCAKDTGLGYGKNLIEHLEPVLNPASGKANYKLNDKWCVGSHDKAVMYLINEQYPLDLIKHNGGTLEIRRKALQQNTVRYDIYSYRAGTDTEIGHRRVEIQQNPSEPTRYNYKVNHTLPSQSILDNQYVLRNLNTSNENLVKLSPETRIILGNAKNLIAEGFTINSENLYGERTLRHSTPCAVGKYKGYDIEIKTMGTHPAAYIKPNEGLISREQREELWEMADSDCGIDENKYNAKLHPSPHGGFTYSRNGSVGWDYNHMNDRNMISNPNGQNHTVHGIIYDAKCLIDELEKHFDEIGIK